MATSVRRLESPAAFSSAIRAIFRTWRCCSTAGTVAAGLKRRRRQLHPHSRPRHPDIYLDQKFVLMGLLNRDLRQLYEKQEHETFDNEKLFL
jgi:hypothetical protein